jgi:hypothetical protein
MMVCADKARQNDLSGAIHDFRVRKPHLHLSSIANADDVFALGYHGAIPDHAVVGAQCHYDPIFKSCCHVRSFRFGSCNLGSNKQCMLFSIAVPQGDRAGAELLGINRTSDAKSGIRVGMTLPIERDCQIRAARTVSAGYVEIVIEIGDFL